MQNLQSQRYRVFAWRYLRGIVFLHTIKLAVSGFLISSLYGIYTYLYKRGMQLIS